MLSSVEIPKGYKTLLHVSPPYRHLYGGNIMPSWGQLSGFIPADSILQPDNDLFYLPVLF
jgi:hypothetical protein